MNWSSGAAASYAGSRERTWARLLGRAPEARLLILHADDVGMCESSVSAFRELTELGTVSSGSVMVPCPWFPAAAEWCAGRGGVDCGVHLTLTSEWSGYRWGPVSRRDAADGLMDAAGYFHKDRNGLNRSAAPEAVAVEMRAQVERALAAGIELTHIDAHMFAALSPRWIGAYAALAREFRLPALLWESAWEDVLFPAEDMAAGPVALGEILAGGFLPIDRVLILDSSRPDERPRQLRKAIAELHPGVTHLLVHPARDGDELRAIAPAGWRNRVADYEALRDASLLDYLREEGVELIGYRQLRAALYAG